MLTILKYLKTRYIDSRLDEKAQGMVEYALLIAFVVGIAAYLIYGNNSLGQNMQDTFDSASDTLDAANRNSQKSGS